MKRLIIAPLLAAVAIAAMALVSTAGAQERAVDDVPEDLTNAIELYVESNGGVYAGDCLDIPQDGSTIGQYCSVVDSLTDTTATVFIGKVATNDIETVTFMKIEGEWQPEGSGPQQPEVPQGLMDAIEGYVLAFDGVFAGLCSEQDGNPGEWCATVEELDDDSATVHIGLVASDDIRTVKFVKLQDGSWDAPADEPAQPAVPQQLLDAIERYTESHFGDYAGLCSEQDGQPGQFCATIDNLTATSATVYIGKVASDEIHTVPFTVVNGEWQGPAAQPEPTPVPAPQDLMEAFEAYVKGIGGEFAGLCSEQDATEGQFCVVVKSLSDNKAEVQFVKVGVGVYRNETFVKAGGSWKLETTAPAPQAPADLVKAIETYVKGLGKEFAGACEDANPGTDAGKFCYIIISQDSERAVVAIGAVASDAVTRVTFLNTGSGWRLGGTGGGTPLPPNSGTGGSVDSDGADDTGLLLGGGLIALGGLVAAGAFTLARRHSATD